MAAPERSDALVFFGATGDLGYKQIFPALLGLVRAEGLRVPVIGVAKAGWTLDQFRARAADPDGVAALYRRRLQRPRHVHGSARGTRAGGAAAALSRGAPHPVRHRGGGPGAFGPRQERAAGDREAIWTQPRNRQSVEPRTGEAVP